MADNGNAWYVFLEGASVVIASKLGGSEQIPECTLQHFGDVYMGHWLLRNFTYRDIVISVVQDRPPLLSSNRFLTLDEQQLPDSHFGLASDILEILSSASTLRAKVKTLSSVPLVPGGSMLELNGRM